jgi:hypothetical protein
MQPISAARRARAWWPRGANGAGSGGGLAFAIDQLLQHHGIIALFVLGGEQQRQAAAFLP